jgi:hypothetical protein
MNIRHKKVNVAKMLQNKEKNSNIGFWGCSCKFEVVANDHDTETYSEKHWDKKNQINLHFLEHI